jgi:hypothetical protein
MKKSGLASKDAEWKRNPPADFSLATRSRLDSGIAPAFLPLTNGKLGISTPAGFSRPLVTDNPQGRSEAEACATGCYPEASIPVSDTLA